MESTAQMGTVGKARDGSFHPARSPLSGPASAGTARSSLSRAMRVTRVSSGVVPRMRSPARDVARTRAVHDTGANRLACAVSPEAR